METAPVPVLFALPDLLSIYVPDTELGSAAVRVIPKARVLAYMLLMI